METFLMETSPPRPANGFDPTAPETRIGESAIAPKPQPVKAQLNLRETLSTRERPISTLKKTRPRAPCKPSTGRPKSQSRCGRVPSTSERGPPLTASLRARLGLLSGCASPDWATASKIHNDLSGNRTRGQRSAHGASITLVDYSLSSRFSPSVSLAGRPRFRFLDNARPAPCVAPLRALPCSQFMVFTNAPEYSTARSTMPPRSDRATRTIVINKSYSAREKPNEPGIANSHATPS
jgi:hypothetical protein